MYVFMMIDQDHIVSEPSTYNHLFRRNFKTVPSSPHNNFNYKDNLNVKRAVLILQKHKIAMKTSSRPYIYKQTQTISFTVKCSLHADFSFTTTTTRHPQQCQS